MTIGQNIKRIRKEKGLTQKQLGELCNIDEANIRKYENGKQNPRIDTIDRIAAALDVNIVDIMEHFTIEQWKTTSEYARLERLASAHEGIVAILAELYGKAESKEPVGQYGSGHYYLIGDDSTSKFVLYDGDIDTLYDAVTAFLPFLVDRMKDERPEEEILQDYINELNTPIPEHLIPDRFK